MVSEETIYGWARIGSAPRPAIIHRKPRSRRRGETWETYVRRTVEESLPATRGTTDDVRPRESEVRIGRGDAAGGDSA